MDTNQTPTPASKPSGIYLLPNILTTSALFSGFYAIIASQRGDFEAAAVAIFIALIFDALDGRVARLTQTQSAFGAEFDSLSDMVCSGVAPSLVAYTAGVITLGKPGWLAAFFYTAATALRLARFNIQIVEDKRFFNGLPCPAAAGLITALLWTAHDYQITGHKFNLTLGVLLVVLGALMVSNIKYYSFKSIDFKGKVPFIGMLFIVLLFMFISLDPPATLLSIFGLFVASGPLWWVKSMLGRLRRKR